LLSNDDLRADSDLTFTSILLYNFSVDCGTVGPNWSYGNDKRITSDLIKSCAMYLLSSALDSWEPIP